jgi:hypothetical protein
MKPEHLAGRDQAEVEARPYAMIVSPAVMDVLLTEIDAPRVHTATSPQLPGKHMVMLNDAELHQLRLKGYTIDVVRNPLWRG